MVTVVIPNYNGREYLEKCLVSLADQTFCDFETVVVDDCSTDESFRCFEMRFPEVTLIMREKNGGFSAAVNDGIRYALKKESEYVILLNNDTEVAPDFIEKLYNAAESHSDCFAVQAKLVSMKEPKVADDTGNFYTLPGWAYARGKGKPADKYNKPGKIFSACAGAAIYRTAVFEKIGLFDEIHFAYLEDVDIGYRARIFGYYNYYEPGALVYHAGSATSGSRYNEFKTRLSARNSILLIYKNQTVLQWFLHLPYLLAGFLVKQLFFVLKGYGKIYHRSVMEGLRMAFSKQGRAGKVVFRWKNLKHYLVIEWELWLNTLRKIFAD